MLVVELTLTRKHWQMVAPFVTAGETVRAIEVLHVELRSGGMTGRAETLGVDYRGETVAAMEAQLMDLSAQALEQLTLEALQALLPPGGARNGVDCALWDMMAKQAGGIAAITGIHLAPVDTVLTLALDGPEAMAQAARAVPHHKHLKLKLDESEPLACLEAVRSARPDAQIIIDANGSWSMPLLTALGDALAQLRVALLEQPLAPGTDAGLAGLNYPVPLCADESCQSSADLEALSGRYDAFNIKLDKCGGLTDAMVMHQWCLQRDKLIMVGNMLGSSLAMAPAMLVAQGAAFVDLDGPLWQTTDVLPSLSFAGGRVAPPDPRLWG